MAKGVSSARDARRYFTARLLVNDCTGALTSLHAANNNDHNNSTSSSFTEYYVIAV